MEREIKFRAWHFGLQRMFSSEEMTKDQLGLLPDGHFANIDGTHTSLSRIFSHQEMLPMQFTGLRDIDGNEVYEGDILKQPIEEHNGRFTETVGYGIYEVKYKPDIYMIIGEGEGEWLCLEEFKGSTVIGNIYQNKNLLEHAH